MYLLICRLHGASDGALYNDGALDGALDGAADGDHRLLALFNLIGRVSYYDTTSIWILDESVTDYGSFFI